MEESKETTEKADVSKIKNVDKRSSMKLEYEEEEKKEPQGFTSNFPQLINSTVTPINIEDFGCFHNPKKGIDLEYQIIDISFIGIHQPQ